MKKTFGGMIFANGGGIDRSLASRYCKDFTVYVVEV